MSKDKQGARSQKRPAKKKSGKQKVEKSAPLSFAETKLVDDGDKKDDSGGVRPNREDR